MDYSSAEKIYVFIKSTEQTSLHQELCKKAIEYAHIRANWFLISDEERRAKDHFRTSAHNSFIDACNILSRNMQANGEDIHWRSLLGDDRKEIGDFACWLHAFLAIKMR